MHSLHLLYANKLYMWFNTERFLLSNVLTSERPFDYRINAGRVSSGNKNVKKRKSYLHIC